MSKTETINKPKVAVKHAVEPPSLFNVIFMNDNVTTMEFVIESLIQYFEYNTVTAEKITTDIHDAGSACVAVLPYEIAEQKGIEITISARTEGYPLQIKLEPETA
jgi:ATP-dependent Clp protease adaptor protein ClpS